MGGWEEETPDSGEPGAQSLNPGGSLGEEERKPVVMLTLEQLRRFGPRDMRLVLEARMPYLKRGGSVVEWDPHAAGSREGGT